MDLVYIYGPPATGKLTVARALAAGTGYKLFHNHLSIDCVRPVFDFGTEPFWRQVHSIRQNMLEEAARSGVSLVYTSVYSHPRNLDLVEKRFAAVEREGGRVCPVQLICDAASRESRLISQERVELNKLTALEVLNELMQREDLLSPIPGWESLVIDNTALSPDEVASRIVEHFRIIT